MILSVAILITGVIAFSKLSYWERSVRIFNLSSDIPFERRIERGPESGRRYSEGDRFNRQERPGEGSVRPGMSELPDSIRARFEVREGRSGHGMSNNEGRGRGEFPGSKKINLRNVKWFLAVFASFTVVVIYVDILNKRLKTDK